ncbi:hypothetical protein E1B28_002757 [Marasmius oreades]|uniref:Uncharacterized protein n=1 Tax=Marasmius oreades TaxID=181124 RepID=A0A9P7UNE4_9AGAR|nr:uncharacterized protein E1B28_002757 [Marasmius oreades]KAG7086836.1 hypothetical protein E1B28_002757 [Marasmius oreades]
MKSLTHSMARRFLFTALASITVLSLFYLSQSPSSVHHYIQSIHSHLPTKLQSIMPSYSLTPNLKGWHSRSLSTPYPGDPEGYQPKLENLVFVALQNAQAIPEGFSLAVFKHDDPNQNVAVDATGRVLLLSESDYAGLTTLSQKITIDLPDTGNFRNTWVVNQLRTSQPIDRFFVKGAQDGKLKETSVQGWSEDKRELKDSVGEYTELPETLAEFVGLVREAREGFEFRHGQTDPPMVKKVKQILPDDI